MTTVAIGDVDAPTHDRGVLLLRYEVAWHPFGHLRHTLRHGNGTWLPPGDVNAHISVPGPVAAIAATSTTPGEAQFLIATEDGHLWHTVRHYADGSWSALGDVFGQIADPGPVHAVAATSSENGEAEFLFCTDDGHLWHTLRHGNGDWIPLGDVNAQIAIPGPVRAIAATSTTPAEAQFLFVTDDGHLWHTTRQHSSGAWGAVGDVLGQIANPGPVHGVAATTSESGEAEFLFCTDDGHLWHTIRHSNGTWAPLGDVNAQISIPGPVRALTATSATPGEAQFLFATDDGHLWHTTRQYSSGAWSATGDVLGQIADPGPVHALAAARCEPGEAEFLICA